MNGVVHMQTYNYVYALHSWKPVPESPFQLHQKLQTAIDESGEL